MCLPSMKRIKYSFVNRIQPFAAWIFAVCSFVPQAASLFVETDTGWQITDSVWKIVITIIWALAGIVVFGFQFYFYIKHKRWAVINLENKLYDAAMNAQEKSHEAKMKSILQITYGNVPEWNPRNFEDNVLLYDGHEHLRRILIDMRDAIREVLSTAEKRVDADAVSVDLIYCYPGEGYDGLLPCSDDNANRWRIIKSGNSSIVATINGKKADTHDFLKAPESFYHSLSKKGYEFRNSKCRRAGKKKCCKCQPQDTSSKPDNSKKPDTPVKSDTSISLAFTRTLNKLRRFIKCNSKPDDFAASLKDIEYNCVGSIAGQMLAIRKDQPSAVLLNAVLTITTYGVKLCADDNGVNKKEFKEIFRSSFINPYKFLLESELAQLYIRHAIREQKMCKKTGIANIESIAKPKNRQCMLQNQCDCSTLQACSFMNEATASTEQNTSC